mgnify:CR=1 FL=1
MILFPTIAIGRSICFELNWEAKASRLLRSANVQRRGLRGVNRGGLRDPHQTVVDLSLSHTATAPVEAVPSSLLAFRQRFGLHNVSFFSRVSDTQDKRVVPVQQRCPKAAPTPPTN